MRFLVLLVAAALMLAGCAGDDGEPADPTNTVTADPPAPTNDEPNVVENGSAPPSQAAVRYNETIELQFTELDAGTQTTSGTNCAILTTGGAFEVLYVDAMAEWTAGATTQQLELRVFGNGTDDRVAGASPLQLTLENLGTHDDDNQLYILVSAPANSAAIDQAVTLSMVVDYIAEGTISASTAACSIGG